ncbi:MAG: hypothetical protein ABI675_31080 [Chitinophagaceae bacterium]
MKDKIHVVQPVTSWDSSETKSYEVLKKEIAASRKRFFIKYMQADTPFKKEWPEEIKYFWINAIGNDLYHHWKNTPWDFNGTTTEPGQGTIACGFFVATLLQDMGLKVNRRKLSICASSQMMRSLVPKQPLRNLSQLSYINFNEKLKEYGIGVYIIGLDYHTGFIVNDGKENWFIHSNYIGRKGVTKETVTNSAALKSSKTRWIVSLTGDKDFLQRWLNG